MISFDSTSHANGVKRAVDDDDADDVSLSRKITKIHPFFAKPSDSPSPPMTSSFQWLPNLGTSRTCLCAIQLSPKASNKVAAFDLDGTIIKSSLKNKDKLEWAWWHRDVPQKLREVVQEGYALVIISNQALKPKPLEEWKQKIPLIARAMSDVPFRLFAAVAKDSFRKPLPGMWDALEAFSAAEGVQIDRNLSFFVGDAAGRKSDFAGTDRKWAENVGLQFYTPEEYFLKRTSEPYSLVGFHPRSLPASSPSLPPQIPSHAEVVLFSGFPALGKSTYFRRFFAPQGYACVNQDTLGSRQKCVKEVERVLHEGGRCVVDNTNRNIETRKYYVDIAKKRGMPIRCLVFEGTMELAWHNNLYRAFNLPLSVASKEPKRALVPFTVFTSFRNAWEEPSPAEGFHKVERVRWSFDGSPEERARWEMWLSIDGK